MSIRTRLLIAIMVLGALGLLGANAATYAFLQNSLLNRVDQQLVGVRNVALRVLANPSRSNIRELEQYPRAVDGPRSTYAELRNEAGVTISAQSFGFSAVEAPPQLPAKLPGSGEETQEMAVFTSGAMNEAGFRYRVMAAPLPRGGTLIVAIPLVEVDETLRRLLFVEAAVTMVVLFAMAMVSRWLVRVGLRPLEQMGDAAGAIAAGELSRRVEPSNETTEVGRLGKSLNAMLSRIEQAFEEKEASESRLRRFVADASHELRTPLTSVRGYAELFRRGADTRPEDLQKSMRRIEEEAIRMGELVEEMLLLAHLDEGRPLQKEKFDLSELLDEVVVDARFVSDSHEIELQSAKAIEINGDRAKLQQVFSNLVNNALVHTPSGTKVVVAVSNEGEEAEVQVRDWGPGLASDDAVRVFDRFYRVDRGRSRESGGAGLGLSIVAAIIEAHGGSVSVETAPNKGATFRVKIPLN